MIYGINVVSKVNYVADFGNIPHISMDEEWWNPTASSVFQVGGKQIAAAGQFSLSYVSTANCLAFNKDIYSTMNRSEDLYDLVRDGKWTQDKFYEIASAAARDLDGNGTIDGNDIRGCGGTGKAFFHMMMIGAGEHYVTMDKEGYPTVSISSNDKMVSLITKLVNNQIADPNAYAMAQNADTEGYEYGFADGAFLFYVV